MNKVMVLLTVFGTAMIAGGITSIESEPSGAATATGIGGFVLGFVLFAAMVEDENE